MSALALLLVLSAVPARAGIELPAVVEVEVPVVVRVVDDQGRPKAGATVRATLRPGLAGAEELGLGITDARGELRWTPTQPGVVALRADNERARTQVRWAEPPSSAASTLALLLALGLVLTVTGMVRPALRR